MSHETCIFCKIIQGDLSCDKVYEDDDILAFRDIRPVAPVHVLVIPKRHLDSLAHVSHEDQAVLGELMLKLKDIAAMLGLHDGFRTIVNTGKIGGQEVHHLHIHIVGGPHPVGPMVVG